MKASGTINAIRMAYAAFAVLALFALTVARNEEWRDPVAFWTDALRKAPGKSRSPVGLAHAYLKLGDEASAERYLNYALRIKPYHPIALKNLASIHMGRGEFDTAVSLLERAQSKYPDDSLWYMLGTAYEGAGRLAEAEHAFGEAVGRNPEDINAAISLGHILRASGRTEEMIALLRGAVERNPRLLEVQPFLRDVLRGETGEAGPPP